MLIRIAFNEHPPRVMIEHTRVEGTDAILLDLLREPFLMDQAAGRDPSRFTGTLGDELAHRLGMTGQSLRQRVRHLRKHLAEDFRQHGVSLETNDVIENRPWHGYRLNPVTVRIVRWDEMELNADTDAQGRQVEPSQMKVP
jgi:hypothetical protein